ncbi:MAG: MopE-related protein, partial [bacterium]
MNPGAAETWYDGLDQDCSGGGDFDQDGDGFATDTYADAGGLLGDDCDDAVATINPGETETWYDGDDQDCSGGSDFDQDGDG